MTTLAKSLFFAVTVGHGVIHPLPAAACTVGEIDAMHSDDPATPALNHVHRASQEPRQRSTRSDNQKEFGEARFIFQYAGRRKPVDAQAAIERNTVSPQRQKRPAAQGFHRRVRRKA